MEETMRFKKFAAIILMSTMIGTMSLSGCGGVNKDAVAITMTSDDKDAIEVTMGYANFAARIQQAGYDSVFASYYGDDYWTNDSYAKDGKNMQESIKDSVLESIETQYLLEKHMSDYGVEITEEDQAAIKKAAEQFMSDNSKAALKEVGATQEYVERYLTSLPVVNQDLDLIISQLQSTEYGVPVQIYFFSRNKIWKEYERIQSDIFDHFFAMIPKFELKVYQYSD